MTQDTVTVFGETQSKPLNKSYYDVIQSNTIKMVKNRISATVEASTVEKLEEILKKGRFRNKSHAIEDAIALLYKEVCNE